MVQERRLSVTRVWEERGLTWQASWTIRSPAATFAAPAWSAPLMPTSSAAWRLAVAADVTDAAAARRQFASGGATADAKSHLMNPEPPLHYLSLARRCGIVQQEGVCGARTSKWGNRTALPQGHLAAHRARSRDATRNGHM